MRVSCAGYLDLGWSLVIKPPKKPELGCITKEGSYFEKVFLGSIQFENKSAKGDGWSHPQWGPCTVLNLSSALVLTWLWPQAAKCCFPLLVKEPSDAADLPSRAHSGPSSDHLGAAGRLLYSAKKEEWRLTGKHKEGGGGNQGKSSTGSTNNADSIKARYLTSKSDDHSDQAILRSDCSKSFNEMERAPLRV